jgi:uncharacterized protein (TIGR02118 family)
MAKLVVIYKTPKDKAHFDAHYAATHIPLAKKIPGVRKYEVSKGPIASPGGDPGVHLVATLTFDSVDAIAAGFASAEGKAAAGDLANFASGGADLLMFESEEV